MNAIQTPITELQAQGLMGSEPIYVGPRFTVYAAHVTGTGHKIHRSGVTVFHDTGRYNVDRPVCGSERWGTYRNSSLTKAAVTCGRCDRTNFRKES